MADLPAAVVAIAKASADVQAISGDRVFWGDIPQNSERPNVRLSTASNVPLSDLDGANLPRRVRVRADCFSFRHSEAWNLAEAIVEAFALPATSSGLTLSCPDHLGPNDRDGEDTPSGYIFFVQVDLSIWASQPA